MLTTSTPEPYQIPNNNNNSMCTSKARQEMDPEDCPDSDHIYDEVDVTASTDCLYEKVEVAKETST